MAITLASNTPVHQGVEGSLRYKVFRVTGPASYTTGGTTFTPAEVFMSRIVYTVGLGGFTNGTLIVYPQFSVVGTDGTQNMMFCAGAAAGAGLSQFTSSGNLSGYEGLIKVYGT